MSKKIITTLGPGGWELYGKRFVESFKRYWPSDIQLEVWHHDLADASISYPGVSFHAIDNLDGFLAIKKALGTQAKDGPSLNYAFKAMALASAVTPDLDWIGFVDADTETMRPVEPELLAELFDDAYHLTYLYRKAVKESEGSWFAFNLKEPVGASLLADYYGLYATLEAFHYKKAHDNAVLDRLVTIHLAHGLKVKNLSVGATGLDAFHQSMLGAYMIHYKGPNKDTIADPSLRAPARYGVLCDIIKHAYNYSVESPAFKRGQINVVEVGTWNGSRAIQIAESVFSGTSCPAVHYVGYDTFEGGNDRTLEGHTKPHATLGIVQRRLENYAAMMRRKGKEFSFELIKGNTLDTMRTTAALCADADVAYIDGGHSYETVKSDYEHLKHVPFVVFDDVILKEEPGRPEGPIRVFEEATESKQAFNSDDRYLGLSQTISFGIVTRKGFPAPQLKQQLVVKPMDSVDKGEQFNHIIENTAAISKWIDSYQAHNKVALLVSAGPTLPEFLEDIRQKQAAGAVVFAVKHAYPTLKAAGIVPDFTVVLDPRPVDGMSTHGIMRTELFASVDAGEKFLFATMTHPSVRKLLEAHGADLYGWHAYTQSSQNADLKELHKGLVIGGGTCSALRMPTIAFVMGFRRLEFYGFDFYYPKNTKQENIKQQLITVEIGNTQKQYLTTGELVAAMQDVGNWVKWIADNKLTVTWHGDGAGGEIWRTIVHGYHNLKEYPW